MVEAIVAMLCTVIPLVLAAWAESAKAKKQEQPYDEIDAHILQHLGGNPAGLVNLSRDLERLHTKAQRRRHS